MKTHQNTLKQAQAASWLRRSGVFCTYPGIAVGRSLDLGENPGMSVCRMFTN